MVPVIIYKQKIYEVKIYKQIVDNMYKGQVTTQLQLIFSEVQSQKQLPIGTLLLITFFPPSNPLAKIWQEH